VMTVSVCLSVCLETAPRKDDESARDNHLLACNFAKYSLIYKKKFTDRLSNKPILINLVIGNPTTPKICSYTTR